MKPWMSMILFVCLIVPAAAGTGKAGVATQPVEQGSDMPTTLAAPTHLQVKVVPSGLELSWDAAPPANIVATGYEIFRSKNYSGPYVSIALVDWKVLRYVDASASAETVYFYRVSTRANGKRSDYSVIATGEIRNKNARDRRR
jgi:hypothetical protein